MAFIKSDQGKLLRQYFPDTYFYAKICEIFYGKVCSYRQIHFIASASFLVDLFIIGFFQQLAFWQLKSGAHLPKTFILFASMTAF